MGLTISSVGLSATDFGLKIEKKHESDLVVTLAGNPNVGKSTVFNRLTGLKQHTGNWPGKTVANAQGYCEHDGSGIILVDIPGCYSLLAHSPEEEVARDFICFGGADKTVVVCDATCLERNLNLILQTLEISGKCIVCLNFMDEAQKKSIVVDKEKLSEKLGAPVIGTAARSGNGLCELTGAIIKKGENSRYKICYPDYIEESIKIITPSIREICEKYEISPRWLALRLIDCDDSLKQSLKFFLHRDLFSEKEINAALESVGTYLSINGITKKQFRDDIAKSIITEAEKIYSVCVKNEDEKYDRFDRKIDRIITSKHLGFPIMIIMLGVVFWLTISGANYPSQLLSNLFAYIEKHLMAFLLQIKTPAYIYEPLINGVYRVLTWVVSVMLPPMAIFFPLFTLLEDSGFLPRIAFNLDKCFSCCNACGKQSLSMCMGDYML